jgi:hypothetical protein
MSRASRLPAGCRVCVMRRAILVAALLAACQPCPYQVVAEVTVQGDGGPATADLSDAGVYCASACSQSEPCPAGEYCSPVVNASDGPPGLCFPNADAGR